MSKQSGTRSYPAEFREKAVRLVIERGYTLKQVADQLECSEESVRRWKEAKVQIAAHLTCLHALPPFRNASEERIRRENVRYRCRCSRDRS